MTENVERHDAPAAEQAAPARGEGVVKEDGVGTSLATFFTIAALLVAVVGAAWYMGENKSTDQANVPAASDTSATGAGAGETGSDKQ